MLYHKLLSFCCYLNPNRVFKIFKLLHCHGMLPAQQSLSRQHCSISASKRRTSRRGPQQPFLLQALPSTWIQNKMPTGFQPSQHTELSPTNLHFSFPGSTFTDHCWMGSLPLYCITLYKAFTSI